MKRIFSLLLVLLCYLQIGFAENQLKAIYPFNMNQKVVNEVKGNTTLPLYLEIFTSDIPKGQDVQVSVELPKDFTALPVHGWEKLGSDNTIATTWKLPSDFGRNFDLVYLQAQETAVSGEKYIKIKATAQDWQLKKDLKFKFVAEQVKQNTKKSEKQLQSGEVVSKKRKKVDKSKFNWYIQSIVLPVDSMGIKDDKVADGVIYIKDTSLESFRNRMMGGGATNWSAVFAHPACHLLLEMRNPQSDVRVLKFEAELIDKATGKKVPGLCTSGKVNLENNEGWAGQTGSTDSSTALISLDGKKAQSFILPIYVDYLNILEGNYSLRVTVSGNGQEKITELPVNITKKHNIGLAMVGLAMLAFVIVVLFSGKIKNCIYLVGAKGAITIALFAAIAFGGITLPTTILGDFLHVFLGPFSGLITGVLSGILQYLLMVSLVVLYRKPGVLALMFIVRYILSGLMFGHFTPISILSCCVNIVILESLLNFSGFYGKKDLTTKYMLAISVALGIADACITFINLEQLMFFYRLYYADWYLALYMIINGFLYSSIGAWCGFKTGSKLRQVMGE